MKSNEPYNDTTEPYKNHVPNIETQRNDPETLCGIGRFRPAFLQVFARIGAFIGIYSVSGLLTSTLTVYVNSQVSMLEKQFGFSSSQTGLLMSCNDIGYLCCVIFSGYIARKVHIPRGLGVSTILFGICGIMCALPYFIQDRSAYEIQSSSEHAGNKTNVLRGKQIPMCAIGNSSAVHDADGCSDKDSAASAYNLEKLWIKKVAYVLIAVGMVLQGVGKSTRSPFVTLYVDDAVDKRKTGFYMGIVIGTAIFGPALAYLLGGLFSKIYVTLEPVDITPKDPRWIGAWWLGFLVFGACAILFSLPIMCFPRRLRPKTEVSTKTGKQDMNKKSIKSSAFVLEAKQFLLAVGRVLKNPVYTLVTLSTCLNIIGVAGMLSFLPKYLASQYTIPLWKANMILAISNIMAVSIGSFVGGVITRKIQMTPINTMFMMMIFYAVNIASMVTGLFLGCHQPKLVGGNENGELSSLYTALESQCTEGCSCSDEKYFPICGDDGYSYYSPCHAGCTVQNDMVFTNCTCITSGQAVPGLCDQGCATNLYVYSVFTFIGALFAAFKIIPTLIIKIRCVDVKDRAVSTALSGFLVSLVGWTPGPVIFGRVIDGTCMLWKYICGERQSCELYDIVYFRNALHAYGLTARSLAFLVIVGLYINFRVTKRTEWRNDGSKRKEFEINGEKKADGTKYRQLPSVG